MAILNCGQNSWLIYYPQSSTIVAFFLIGLTLYILTRRFNNQWTRSISFACLLVCSAGALKVPAPSKKIINITCPKGELIAIKQNGMITIIDPGVLTMKNVESFIEFTLSSELARAFGTTTIDHCIFLQPTISSFNAACALCQLNKVKTIHMPFWKGAAHNSILRSYGRLRYLLEKNNIKLERIGHKPITIASLNIQPCNKWKAYHQMKFRIFEVKGVCAGQQIMVTSEKTTKPIDVCQSAQ